MKKTIIGMLLDVAYGRGYYVLSVQISKEDSVTLVVNGEEYSIIFPAGAPLLREIYEFEIQIIEDKPVVTSVFPMNAEVIAAEDIPDFEAIRNLEVRGRKAMDFKSLQEAHDKELKTIEGDNALQDELEAMVKTETEWRKSSINNRLSAVGVEQLFSDSDVDTITNSDKPTLSELARRSRGE
ncbi:hypothetical protein ESZ50_00585 [Weissella muntiaci]|uniref:Uncharacterized protein n=1 Tax=Weissella muntiaci TaxID=2508881 RepID=A0A6C2CAN0_9LACO|nr:hypothetical protein [Weissella muntiaci]TYC51064.1 hypothetical protein ESZ50_00585 [Weissella muntiaci]